MSEDVGGVMVQEGQKAQLTELLAATFGTGVKLHLYLSSFAPTLESKRSDFEAQEPTFIGYAAATPTWGTVGVDGSGNGVAHSSRVLFINTGIAPVDPTQSIGGVWLEDISAVGPPKASTVSRYYPFNTPVSMPPGGSQMSVDVTIFASGLGYATVDF